MFVFKFRAVLKLKTGSVVTFTKRGNPNKIMGRPKRSKSAPFLSTAAVNVKKVNKSKIQLVSVLNPRVLYYLEELVRKRI
jgi:hypothetical protein